MDPETLKIVAQVDGLVTHLACSLGIDKALLDEALTFIGRLQFLRDLTNELEHEVVAWDGRSGRLTYTELLNRQRVARHKLRQAERKLEEMKTTATLPQWAVERMAQWAGVEVNGGNGN